MECAQRGGRLPKPQPNTTLALLVGTSFEPLLQSVWAYKPDRLVPVVNHFYGDRDDAHGNRTTGKAHWAVLRGLIARLGASSLQMPEDAYLETVGDTPTDVFNHLREQLQSDLTNTQGRRVIIDITGAKKTMVAGAYLLAAYYSHTEISYVDFDRWDEGESKPYGYTCKIGQLSEQERNPLRRWALREWEQVEAQYNKHNFAAALDALTKIELPGREEKEAVKRLGDYLRVCDAWEMGDLRTAKQMAGSLPEELQATLPLAIEELGDLWPDPGGKREEMLTERFLFSPRRLRIYANDEIARAERLASSGVRPDSRSAFIRAYALYETLLKARVMGLFKNGHINCFDKRNSKGWKSDDPYLPPDYRKAILHWMLYKMLKSKAYALLKKSKIVEVMLEVNNQENTIELTRTSAKPNLKVKNWSWNDERELYEHRHLIAHTYVSGSHQLAERAIKQANIYFEEYSMVWGREIDSNYDPHEVFQRSDVPGWKPFDVPAWTALTKKCGLSFLL
jgi:hypothetical protein